MIKRLCFLICASLLFFQCHGARCSCTPVEEELKGKINNVMSAVKESNKDDLQKAIKELQMFVDNLIEKSKTSTEDAIANNESGNEVCGDPYTDLVMSLNIMLAPIRTPSVLQKINKMLDGQN